MEELSYGFTKDFFFSCVHVRFYFFTAAHFHLAANISLFLTAAMKFSCFSSNEIRLPSSFSVIHVSLTIKSNVVKDTTLLFFFPLQKSGRPCDFLPLHLGSHTCWLSYFILVCLWCGRTVARCTVTWLPNFLGWIDLLSYGAPHARSFSSAIKGMTILPKLLNSICIFSYV